MKPFAAAALAGLLLTSLLALRPAPALEPAAEGIQWLTMEQAYARNQKQPRKLLIDLYTDWCGWCKVMDRETYTNPKVVAYINKNYYPVKFNAEQREPVTLGGQRFEFIAQGKSGVHQLALGLTNNQPSYPTTVFLDEKMQMIQPLPGYLKAKEFHEVITFFGDNHYQKVPFEKYKAETYPQLYK
jgi:thioredoxin-related protein